MEKSYIVKDHDTLQSIATFYYGTPLKWIDLATHNRLTYPYITADQAFQTQIHATGQVVFTYYQAALSDIVIPAGTRVSDGADRTYDTTAAVTVLTGTRTVTAPVRCTFAGLWGNLGVNSLNTTALTNFTVTNPQALTNGKILNVLKTGQSLFIPGETQEAIVQFSETAKLQYSDLLLLEGQLFVDNYGDLQSVGGVQNIAYALSDRLQTSRGELMYHPEYGSRMHQIIGKNEPFASKLLSLDVRETILQDARVADVIIRDISIGKSVEILCDIRLVGQDNYDSLTFSI